jgi:hypothetical protein
MKAFWYCFHTVLGRSDTNHEIPMSSVHATCTSLSLTWWLMLLLHQSHATSMYNVSYVMCEAELIWLYRFGHSDTLMANRFCWSGLKMCGFTRTAWSRFNIFKTIVVWTAKTFMHYTGFKSVWNQPHMPRKFRVPGVFRNRFQLDEESLPKILNTVWQCFWRLFDKVLWTIYPVCIFKAFGVILLLLQFEMD